MTMFVSDGVHWPLATVAMPIAQTVYITYLAITALLFEQEDEKSLKHMSSFAALFLTVSAGA